MSTPSVCQAWHACHAEIVGYETVHHGSPEPDYRDSAAAASTRRWRASAGSTSSTSNSEPVEMDAAGEPHRLAWEPFGQMLMAYKGWQFKLEIKDRGEV